MGFSRRDSWIFRLCFFALILAVETCISVSSSRSADIDPRSRSYYLTVYGDEFAHTLLYTLPVDAVDGGIDFKKAYYVAGALGYVIVPSFTTPIPFCSCGIKGFSLEAEGQLGHHFGLQDHFESTFALLVRSPQLALPAGFSINAAAGEGVSYAFTLPKYEGSVAAEGPQAAGPRRFLNYLAFETELSQVSFAGWHVLLNVHHRSGIWGVIAPHKTGANYVGGGIRYDF